MRINYRGQTALNGYMDIEIIVGKIFTMFLCPSKCVTNAS